MSAVSFSSLCSFVSCMQWHMPMIADIDTSAHHVEKRSDSKRNLYHLKADHVRLLMFEEAFQGSMREPEVRNRGDLVRQGQCKRMESDTVISSMCLEMSASPKH